MRALLFFLLPALLISAPAYCENINDTLAYKQGISLLDAAVTEEQYVAAGEYFLVLASEDKDHWLPYYYACLSFNLASEKIKDHKLKDGMIDRAENVIARALKLSPEEPELKILQAFIYQARIMVNPAARGLSYSSKASALLDDALSGNPENPRAVMLKAYNIYHTPAILKGGAANALPVFIEAKRLFSIYNPDSGISPQWGEKETTDMINLCRKETAVR